MNREDVIALAFTALDSANIDPNLSPRDLAKAVYIIMRSDGHITLPEIKRYLLHDEEPQVTLEKFMALNWSGRILFALNDMQFGMHNNQDIARYISNYTGNKIGKRDAARSVTQYAHYLAISGKIKCHKIKSTNYYTLK